MGHRTYRRTVGEIRSPGPCVPSAKSGRRHALRLRSCSEPWSTLASSAKPTRLRLGDRRTRESPGGYAGRVAAACAGGHGTVMAVPLAALTVRRLRAVSAGPIAAGLARLRRLVAGQRSCRVGRVPRQAVRPTVICRAPAFDRKPCTGVPAQRSAPSAATASTSRADIDAGRSDAGGGGTDVGGAVPTYRRAR
jgi:hypothetical protein